MGSEEKKDSIHRSLPISPDSIIAQPTVQSNQQSGGITANMIYAENVAGHNIYNIYVSPGLLDAKNQVDYSINFTNDIEFLTQHFVGRQEVIEKIDRFIEENSSGYLAFVGEPGLGKSALCAWLVKNRGYIHHFISTRNANDTPNNFLNSILYQLKEKYTLKIQIPSNAVEASQLFITILEELSQQRKPIVIIVDALNEAKLYRGTHTILDYLPYSLPEHIYFIVTTRPELKLSLQPDVFYEKYNLPPLTFDDTQNYLKSWNQNPNLSEALYHKSEGNPLYLYYVVHSTETLTFEEINNAPKGLEDFYENNWNRYFDNEHEEVSDQLIDERSRALGLLTLLRSPFLKENL